MQIPLCPSRAQVALTPALAANPPLLDLATGMPPDFFVGSSMAFLLAIFDARGNVLNASTLSALTLSLYDDPVTMNLLARSSVASPDIRDQIQIEDWRNGADQQAVVTLGPPQTDGIDFAGQPTRRAWMVINAATTDGFTVVLGAGFVTLRAGAPDAVYLPLLPIPLIIPVGTTYLIPAGVTITFFSAPQILGSIVCAPAEGNLPPGSFNVLDQ